MQMLNTTFTCRGVQAEDTVQGSLLSSVDAVSQRSTFAHAHRGVQAQDTVQGSLLSSVTFTCTFQPAGGEKVWRVSTGILYFDVAVL